MYVTLDTEVQCMDIGFTFSLFDVQNNLASDSGFN